ncbi:MAG: cupredoxin family copper-binding protein [Bacteroidetes bacterium]|nr:cupredoxin family copper-binding protein [Bacteroidota bacterium]MCL5025177.1 cupredoxin family copper-binding protein [Chloroflexota bacterium]
MSTRFPKLLLLVGSLIALLSLVGACSQPAALPTVPPGIPTEVPLLPTIAPPPPAAEVKIVNFSFQPAEVRIKPGQSVSWTNEDSAQHTVTGSGFDSGLLSKGQQYIHVFNQTGTFDYHCSVHPQMQGKVIVQE